MTQFIHLQPRRATQMHFAFHECILYLHGLSMQFSTCIDPTPFLLASDVLILYLCPWNRLGVAAGMPLFWVTRLFPRPPSCLYHQTVLLYRGCCYSPQDSWGDKDVSGDGPSCTSVLSHGRRCLVCVVLVRVGWTGCGSEMCDPITILWCFVW